MTKFTDNLWDDIAREHGATIERAERPAPARGRRSGMIAGATLALAVGGTALGMGLTSGGTAAGVSAPTASGPIKITTDAYTITGSSNGTILVHLKFQAAASAAETKLRSMGYGLQIFPKPGAAPVRGPVACPPIEGAPQHPKVEVLLGDNGTQVITANAQNDGTGVGTWHVGNCFLYPTDYKGNSGTGSASAKAAPPSSSSVTKQSDGSVLIRMSGPDAGKSVEKKLAAMGIRERFETYLTYGPAAHTGPLTCEPAAGVPGPVLKVLYGKDNNTSTGSGQPLSYYRCTIVPKAG